jgi:molecular chaperone HtpG
LEGKLSEATKNETNSYHFKAEIKQVLEILIHSLYKERDIFLRELISNASDALTRLHFEMLVNQDVLDPETELAVHIDLVEDDGEKWIVIKDSGVGMTRAELVQNLGTVAQSGAREFLQSIDEEESDPLEIIGQFGVGFYSAFMVAKKVRVVSRSYLIDQEAAAWVSEGGDEFRIESADKQDRGTEIHVLLKDDALEFHDEWKLRQIVKKHSDYVSYPIYVGEQPANQQQSLWRKSRSEITQEEYKQFYQQFTMDFEEPQRVIHFSSDAPIHIRALLFIPVTREKSVLNLRKESGLQLYSHNVLIQEYSQDLLPRWLAFIEGVVDSEDLPLNVSRETIQNTRIIRQLGRSIRKRILRDLQKLADEDPESYMAFWRQYGPFLKEGLSSDPESKDEILPFLRFQSSTSDGELTTLNAYVERMSDEQEEIYYLLGDDAVSVAFSPHLDPFKARQLEVLYLLDPIDPFITSVLNEFEDKTLRNIADADIELPGQSPPDEQEDAVDIDNSEFNQFVGRCVTTLGDRVLEVRTSQVLRNNPARLVDPAEQPSSDLQRVYRYLEQDYQIPTKIFEVNRQHPLIQDLARLVDRDPGNDLINLSIEQLFESALIIDGLHPNPASILPRVQRIMELAVRTTPSNLFEEEE